MAISVLCVHDIGHGDIDPDLEGFWSKFICDGLVAWIPDLQGVITYDFLKYGSLFEVPPIIRCAAGMVAQWISHRIGRAPWRRSDTMRKTLKHNAPYLPIILEA